MKILLVEDTATLRYTMAAYIKRAGHEAIVAENGEQSLQIIETTPVDLVIMDVEMPGLNGFETTRLMREAFGDHWVPIIFVTGMTDDASFQEGIEAGGDDYLTKPVSPVILKAKIRAFERIAEMQNELKRLNEELQTLSERDELTGLYNRRGFEELAGKQWRVQMRAQEPAVILMIDIDHFKAYNDEFGHQAGDRCLQQVSTALANALHRPADIIGRYGGEEFIVLLPNTDLAGGKVVGETLRQAVADLQLPQASSAEDSTVSISVGGAASQHLAGTPMDELIKQADTALYQAKEEGRNRVSIHTFLPYKTLLIADDDPASCEWLSQQLADHCHIITADNGEDCLEIAYDVHPDLILLNLDQAGMDAGKVCRELKSSRQTAGIPILHLTEEAPLAQVVGYAGGGAEDQLQKPVDSQALMTKVQRYLG